MTAIGIKKPLFINHYKSIKVAFVIALRCVLLKNKINFSQHFYAQSIKQQE